MKNPNNKGESLSEQDVDSALYAKEHVNQLTQEAMNGVAPARRRLKERKEIRHVEREDYVQNIVLQLITQMKKLKDIKGKQTHLLKKRNRHNNHRMTLQKAEKKIQ